MTKNMWTVDQTTEFGTWFVEMNNKTKEDIYAKVRILSEIGPTLGRPHVDTVYGSKHANMKELRITSRRAEMRIFFAFDPERSAILLCGGVKNGDKRFYNIMIPLADRLFDEYLEEKGL